MLELPEIITLEEFEGNFNFFYEAVYQIFVTDFIKTKPVFKGQQLRLKKHPFIAGKEYTFFHFTHEGDIENDRKPDLRRMERISWPKPIINNSEHNCIKVWRNKRKSAERILIFYEKVDYLVVLEDRGSFILPWTAYLIDYPNRKRRLLQEYEAYKNQNRPA